MEGWWDRCEDVVHVLGQAVPIEPALTAAGGLGGALVGAGLAGAALLGARRGWWAKLAAAVPLYSRLRREDVTGHPKRARLLALVRERPGATTAQLVDESRLNGGTLLHHLRVLERAGCVKSLVLGRDRVWFESGVRVDEARLAALSAPARRRILAEVAQTPGVCQADLAARLGLSRPAIHHHVSALREAGLLRLRREGIRTRCFPDGASGTPGGPAVL